MKMKVIFNIATERKVAMQKIFLTLACLVNFSIAHATPPVPSIPLEVGIMPVLTQVADPHYKATTLIEWFKDYRKNKWSKDGPIKDMVREHVAYGMDDKGYRVVKDSVVDPLVAQYEDKELKPNNPFFQVGIKALVFPKILKMDAAQMTQTGEVTIELQIDVVSTETGQLLWSGINKNKRIWDKRNIIAPDMKNYLTRAVRDSLKQLPKANHS
ncbi:MAG: hypothetical protein HYU97_07755 [Deltaproteobacteria bacterium]|nr:hypothetical protein [Deltaproteobacteria bacterium]